MTTHVIILAQGSQTRLPGLRIPKQLLDLVVPGPIAPVWRGNGSVSVHKISILERTFQMLVAMPATAYVTVVGGATIVSAVSAIGRHVAFGMTLNDPGNSSLKGAHQVLANQCDPDVCAADCRWQADRTAILLGDTVYSWKCLREILSPRPIAFVGTGDLGRSEGEIWGISWNRDQDEVMRRAREAALADHPPAHFTEYQPGQLRRWLWAHCNFDRTPVTPYRDYYEVDDYTRDIDIPTHLELLPALARAAYEDDLRESKVSA